jgi:hypothetical protein
MARMVRRWEEWERLVRGQAASGMTVAKYCENSSISVPSFYHWKRRLEAGQRGPKSQPSKGAGLFRQIQLTAGAAVAGQATVRFPSGVELSFGCDPNLVRQVVGQLMAARSDREA